MIKSATEIIKLFNAASASPELTYEPVWISTDRREQDPSKTTLKYAQIGGPTASDKIGNAHGPIFMVEFADLSAISANYIRVWGLDNDDTNAPIYKVTYLTANPKMDVWLKKFEFTDVNGSAVVAGTNYSIFGYRKRQFPVIF